MPGVTVQAEAMEQQSGKKASSTGGATKLSTITAFFKSPSKVCATDKPQDILGHFIKSSGVQTGKKEDFSGEENQGDVESVSDDEVLAISESPLSDETTGRMCNASVDTTNPVGEAPRQSAQIVQVADDDISLHGIERTKSIEKKVAVTGTTKKKMSTNKCKEKPGKHKDRTRTKTNGGEVGDHLSVPKEGDTGLTDSCTGNSPQMKDIVLSYEDFLKSPGLSFDQGDSCTDTEESESELLDQPETLQTQMTDDLAVRLSKNKRDTGETCDYLIQGNETDDFIGDKVEMRTQPGNDLPTQRDIVIEDEGSLMEMSYEDFLKKQGSIDPVNGEVMDIFEESQDISIGDNNIKQKKDKNVNSEKQAKTKKGKCKDSAKESKVKVKASKQRKKTEGKDNRVTTGEAEISETRKKTDEPKPKGTGIEKFFKKKNTSPDKTKPDSPSQTIVVEVEIHAEPSPPQPCKLQKTFDIFCKGKVRTGLEKKLDVDGIGGGQTAKDKKLQCNAAIQRLDESITELDSGATELKDKTEGEKGVQNSKGNKSTSSSSSSEDCIVVEETKKDNKTSPEELEERKLQAAAKLACLDGVGVKTSKKSTQATLTFSGKGAWQMAKPAQATTRVRKRAKEQTERAEGTGDGLKGKKHKKCLPKMVGEEAETSTPDKPKKKYMKQKAGCEQGNGTKVKDTKAGSGGKCVRNKNKRAKEQDVVPGEKDEFTPKSKKKIKSSKSKAQQLLQKAKAVNSSKEGKKKMITNKTRIQAPPATTQPLRRSRRSSAMAAQKAMTAGKQDTENVCIDVEEKKIEEGVGKKCKAKDKKSAHKAPAKNVKGSPRKSPVKRKKVAVKLAPIFSKKRKDDKDASDSSSDDIQVTHVSSEVLRVRREFLFSGVPEELRKQREMASMMQLSEYPPFPTISHVLQNKESEDRSLWDLPQVNLSLKSDPMLSEVSALEALSQGTVTHCEANVPGRKMNMEEKPLLPLSQAVVRLLLAEIKSHNTTFPVTRLYRHLVKNTDNNTCATTEVSHAEKAEVKEGEDTKLEVQSSNNTKKRKLNETTEKEGPSAKSRRQSKRRKVSQESSENDDSQKSHQSLRRRSKRKSSIEIIPVLLPDGEGQNQSDEMKNRDHECPGKEDVKSESVTAISEGTSGGKLDLLWTDKYQPSHSGQILGNGKSVKKLHTWLLEWKQRTDREARHLAKQLAKQAKKEKAEKQCEKDRNDPWDDDSDFEVHSSEEEGNAASEWDEEDDGLCNTTLITGPPGVGKTATVYALAQELGYKVFEVNASSKRNGKQILSDLQEATQSHQVSKNNLDAMFTSFMMIAKDKAAATATTAPKAERKMPAAFANLFSKANKAGKNASMPEQSSKSGKKVEGVKGRGKVVVVEVIEDDVPEIKKGNGKAKRTPAKSKRTPKKATATPSKTPQRKGKKEAVLDRQALQPASKRGLDLSSNSLILFEEVDVAFEDDRGFWAAIQTFMSATKRPIILTANDPHFMERFDGRVEQLYFKAAPLNNVTSFLQVLCLVENVRTDYHDLYPLVALNKGDLRSSILALQFWIQSGAGIDRKTKTLSSSVKVVPAKQLSEENSLGASQQTLSSTEGSKVLGFSKSEDAQDSADDFEDIPRVKHRRTRAIIDDDEDSKCESAGHTGNLLESSMPVTVIPDSQPGSQGSLLTVDTDSQDLAAVDDGAVADAVPLVHTQCFESMTGCSQWLQHHHTLLDLLKTQEGNEHELQELSHYQHQGLDLLYSNLLSVLPLPTVESGLLPTYTGPQTAIPKVRRRIKTMEDLYDSEGSSDSFLTLSQKSQESADSQQDGEHTDNKMETSPGPKLACAHTNKISPVDKLSLTSVEALSDFYETLSFTDSHISSPYVGKEGPHSRNQFHWFPGKVVPGLSDHMTRLTESYSWRQSHEPDLIAAVQAYSTRQVSNTLSTILMQARSLPHPDCSDAVVRLSLPVYKGDQSPDYLRMSQDRTDQTELACLYHKAGEKVRGVLPGHVQGAAPVIAMEYLPVLRTICKCEQVRQATKAKRRFFHYLDNISLLLKQSTIDILCSSFT